MRHLNAGRTLSRSASHRRSLMRNLALALFRHERIVTTVEKAKEARPFVEKLITLAKTGTLQARRRVAAKLGATRTAEVKPDEGKEKETPDPRPIIRKLFDDIAPRFMGRPGGYTRVLKLHNRRLGDAGHTAILELLKAGEVKPERETTPVAPTVKKDE